MAECPTEAVGGFVTAATFYEVQTQRMSGTFMWFGVWKGDLEAFQESSRLISPQSHFVCIHHHTRGPN